MYGLSTLLSRTKGVCLRPTSRLSNVGELQESPHSVRKTCPHAEPNTFDRCDLELPTLKVLVKTIVRKGSLNEIYLLIRQILTPKTKIQKKGKFLYPSFSTISALFAPNLGDKVCNHVVYR